MQDDSWWPKRTQPANIGADVRNASDLQEAQHWTTAPSARSGWETHAVPPKGPISASGTAAADTCSARPAFAGVLPHSVPVPVLCMRWTF